MKIALNLFIFLNCFILGCTVSIKKMSPNEEIHYDEKYDFTDKKSMVKKLVSPLVSKSFSTSKDKPVIIVYGIINKTFEHIDTQAITDEIRMELLKSQKFSFINETQRQNIEKEINYQYSGATSPETRIELARQIGAQYILSGTLYSIEKEEPKQVRLKKKSLKYYSLNLELTDVKTSLIEWADSSEIVREASKPFIGW